MQKKMRKATNVMDDDRIRKIFELKEEGKTYRQIVREMKTSDVSVAKYLKMGLEGSLEYAKKIRESSKSPPKLNEEEITGDEKANLWLGSMDKGSFYSYMTGLAYYCALVNKKPSELINEAIGEIKKGKLLSERIYFMDFERFKAMLKKEGFADTTQSNYQTAVRSFYGFYDIEMPKKKGGRKRRKVKPLRENSKVEITKIDIQNLLDVTKYLRDKALVLAVSSSGLGRAEIRLLDVKDFVNGYDEETAVCVLKDVWRVKTDNDFISFFSSECSAMIWRYLQSERGITKEELKTHLEEPLFTSTKDTWQGSKGLISRLAPTSIDQIFRNLAIRIDVNNAPKETENGNTVFNRFHPHNLRKFFTTQMKNAGMPEIITEFVTGHQIDQTRSSYYLSNPSELKEIYLRYMGAVSIATETQVIQSEEYKELKEALAERNGEIAKLREEMEEMKQEREEIKQEARGKEDEEIVKFLNAPKYRKAIFELMKEFEKERKKD